MTDNNRSFPAEWEKQDGILLAWPHRHTDWAPMLNEIERCYRDIVKAMANEPRIIIVAPSGEAVQRALKGINAGNVTIIEVPTNDTWIRDYGPISVLENGKPRLLNFTFNAWGMKFAANLDNQVNSTLHRKGLLAAQMENHLDFVLEGGSIESDGNGTVMVTSQCLLSPNRNALSKQEIEQKLKQCLNARNILWLDHGFIPGDDTDSHIDTLARFLPDNAICHTTAQPNSKEASAMRQMAAQIKSFKNADGVPYTVFELPAPKNIYDETGQRLPATYANFLLTPKHVYVPAYGQPRRDSLAREILEKAARRPAISINCLPLIKQHGSLHCATMQLTQGTLAP